MKKFRVLCVAGTRPEAIKMAPVIKSLKGAPELDVTVLATAQHRGLLDQVFTLFDIQYDYDLDVMTKNQTLPELTAKLMTGIDDVLDSVKPDIVVAQGDTTTVFVTSLGAFYRKIPFAHVEAGLRTSNLYSPFPEEANRVLTGHLAALHFAPTETARENLLKEGISDENIHVCGNTVIDALLETANRNIPPEISIPDDARVILVTSHRRENFGPSLENICRAIIRLSEKYPDSHIVYPVHPNPNVTETVTRLLSGKPRITLTKPLEYDQFVAVMKRAVIILSDSGGVQEEAPALRKPVLVLRRETERLAALACGVTRLVGTDEDDIVTEASRLLDSEDEYNKMATGESPYGDGHSSEKITAAIVAWLKTHKQP